MLVSLGIRNYILIDSLDISFPAGLVIITGETGAGKSILLGALSLALGSRSDASMVGASGDKCVVEAEFSCEGDLVAKKIAQEEGLDWNDGNLLIRRTLSKNGRSRSFVNDEPVQVGVLQRLSPRLLDIHSQQQTQMLSDTAFQLDLLDQFAGNDALREECAVSFRKMAATRRELSEVRQKIADTSARLDYNKVQLEELERAKLVPDELEELETKQKALANAEEIKSSLYSISSSFSGTDDTPGMDSTLKESTRLLEKVGQYIPAAAKLAERMESSRVELDDIISEVTSLESSTEVSEDELARIEERMSMLYGLLSKHSCRTEDELIALRDSLSSELTGTDSLSERKKNLEKELSEETLKYNEIAEKLHSSRVAASRQFSEETGKIIRGLDLDGAIFSVEFTSAAPGETGKDGVTYLFSSAGAVPGPLSRVASGGERSRIMLGLKAMMARYAEMPAMVFDEIDTGVSGSAADKMGSLICRMGEDMQVFAITHLPQVAAKGNAHYVVSKETGPEGRPASGIHPVAGEDRVKEIARMLSGSTITPEAMANARRLLA